MGMSAILVKWPKQFVQILANLFKESSYEIWVQLAQWFLRKLCFNKKKFITQQQQRVRSLLNQRACIFLLLICLIFVPLMPYYVWIEWNNDIYIYIYIYNILMGLQYERLGWKVNLDLWNFYIAIVTLD